MTVIRVIYDGRAFVPQQPLSLPAQSEALVIVADDAGGADPAARARLDAAVRAYYQGAGKAGDAEDDAWAGRRRRNRTAPGTRIERCRALSRAGARCGSSSSPTTPSAARPDRVPRRPQRARHQRARRPRSRPTSAPPPTHVPLPAGQGGLAHDSMARCENVSYLHKSRLARGPLAGRVDAALMAEVERCLLRALGVAV
jgi:mRNA-degrading endonuclease toxin of MazEF toxin-antitoxin module